MSFGSRFGSYLLLSGFLVFEGDYYYAQDGALSKQQLNVATAIAGYSLAGAAIGLVLMHFGGRHQRNHPEKFALVAGRKKLKAVKYASR